MKIREFRMWEPVTGVEHLLEIFRYGQGNGYVLMLDNEFYADGESFEDVEEEMMDALDWFGWSAMRPVA